MSRITFRNSTTGEEVTKDLAKEQESNEVHYKDKETGAELEVIEKMPLLEWLANNYKKFGCQLEFVTNKSQVHSPPSLHHSCEAGLSIQQGRTCSEAVMKSDMQSCTLRKHIHQTVHWTI